MRRRANRLPVPNVFWRLGRAAGPDTAPAAHNLGKNAIMDDHNGLQWARAAWTRRVRPRQILQLRYPRRWRLRRQRPPGYWPKTVNRVLAHLASIALIIALAYRLARITWALVPGAPLDAPAPLINPDTLPRPPESAVVDIQRIVAAHLFGEYVEHAPEPVVPIREAPETQLDLLLKATVAEAREDRRGAAVIASAGIERTYTVSEEIEGTGGAVLHAIHTDRVILNLAGQFETLRLPRSGTGQ